jgi:hypothetical protein
MTTKRINSGIYQIKNQGKTFQCEKTEYGQWMMLIFVESNTGLQGQFEYCNHYLTLSDCKYIIQHNINEF